MSNAETADNPRWEPKVLPGGKGPVEPNAENWLSQLDKGTIFLYRKRASHPSYSLSSYQVIFQWGDAALLGRRYEDPNQPDQLEYVDTRLFSQQNEWFKTLMVLPQKEEETGEQHE